MRFWDNFRNFLSGLGVPDRDKSVSTEYTFVPMQPQQIEAAYRQNWIARKAIKIPAEDMTREWRSWQAEDDQITEIEKVEKKFKVQHKVRLAMVRARTYGGAGLYIGLDEDQSQPLDVERVKQDGLKFLHVMPAHHLNAAEPITDPMNEWFGEPQYYQLAGPMLASMLVPVTSATPWPDVPAPTTATVTRDPQSAAATGLLKIHPSRVIRFIGNELPDDTMLAPLWGDSVLNTLDSAIKQAGSTMQSIAALVQEAKVDVIKIKGLADAMGSDEYTSRMIGRFSHSNVAKSVINSLLIDSEEDWQRLVVQFGGMSDVLMTYLNIVAGAADIPVTRFFGRAPAGLNATGESDIRNYYDRLRSDQTSDLQPKIERLDEVILRSALGDRPDEIFYEWNSLWQLSEAEQATMEYQKAQAFKIDADTALIPQTALSQGRINQVIETGFYPGLEQAIADAEAAGDMILTPEEEMQRQLEQQAQQMQLQAKLAPPQPGQKQLAKPQVSDWLRRATALLDEMKGQRARPFVGDFSPDQPRDRFGKWTRGGDGELTAAALEAIAQSDTPASDLFEATDDDVSFEEIVNDLTPEQKTYMEGAERAIREGVKTTSNVRNGGFKRDDGTYTPERTQLHVKIVDELLTDDVVRAATPPIGEVPTLTLTGGRAGAGKTTSFNQFHGDKQNFFFLSADDIQAKLPGYSGKVAGLFNEEAQDIALQAEKIARALRLNIVYDATMKTTKSAVERVQEYKRDGYVVDCVFTHTKPSVSTKRTIARAMGKTGRYVPPQVSFNARTNEQTFDALIPQFRRWALFDNNGTAAKLIAKGGAQ